MIEIECKYLPSIMEKPRLRAGLLFFFLKKVTILPNRLKLKKLPGNFSVTL
jgi:hypothetical protein